YKQAVRGAGFSTGAGCVLTAEYANCVPEEAPRFSLCGISGRFRSTGKHCHGGRNNALPVM
ncbi:hypothetical protein ABTD73_20040, partial [Acinetobacter baumannii]